MRTILSVLWSIQPAIVCFNINISVMMLMRMNIYVCSCVYVDVFVFHSALRSTLSTVFILIGIHLVWHLNRHYVCKPCNVNIIKMLLLLLLLLFSFFIIHFSIVAHNACEYHFCIVLCVTNDEHVKFESLYIMAVVQVCIFSKCEY